jgi:hypothetical protein
MHLLLYVKHMLHCVKQTLHPMEMTASHPSRWLLLLHQVPPKPNAFRVKVWRRLQRIGAVAVKNAAYVLPDGERTREDFEWLLREILDGGGDAVLCEVSFVEGLSDTQMEALFRSARDADFASVAEEARGLTQSLGALTCAPEGQAEAATQAERLRRRLLEVAAIDFFGAPGRAEAEAEVAALELAARGGAAGAPVAPRAERVDGLRGRTWVTRSGVHVDRIASAWLIRSFVDPEARFRFVGGKRHAPAEGEIRFDMFEAEFTHEGDRCTFEVMIERIGLDAPALRPIAEIVHDLDLKDGKFARPEGPGLDRMIDGITEATRDDEERIARGAMLFDTLYRAFGGTHSSTF